MIMIMIADMVKVPRLIRVIPTLPRTGVMTEQVLVVICPDFSRMQRDHEVLSTILWLRPTTGWITGNGPAVMAIMSTMMFPINTWVRVIMIRQTQESVGARYVEITASLPNWIHTNFNLRPSRCTNFSTPPSCIQIPSSASFSSSIRLIFHCYCMCLLINRFKFVSTALFPLWYINWQTL